MPETFDPYHEWLGIPSKDQPPNHYRLLGIELFEAKSNVIEAAADRQMAHLRTYQTGTHAALSQRLLNEVARAKIILLHPDKRKDYDARLQFQRVSSRVQTAPASPVELGPPARPVKPSQDREPSAGPATSRPSWRQPTAVAGALGLAALLTVVVVVWLNRTRPVASLENLAPAVDSRPTVAKPEPAVPATPEHKRPVSEPTGLTPAPAEVKLAATEPTDSKSAPAETRPASTDLKPAPAETRPAPTDLKPAPANIPTTKPAASTPSPTRVEGLVCGRLAVNLRAEELIAGAIPFKAPRGDGRYGANGFLVPPAPDKAGGGSAWSCEYRRTGSAHGIQFIHPCQSGHVLVTAMVGLLTVASPGPWPDRAYTGGYPGISLEQPADFKRVFELGPEPHQLKSVVQSDGQFEFYCDGRLVASGRVEKPLPLEFTSDFQGPNLPMVVPPGTAGIIIGPSDRSLNEARTIVLAPIAPVAEPSRVAGKGPERPTKTGSPRSGKTAGARAKRLSPRLRYQALLGVYANDNKPIPFINLSVPKGSNIDNDAVRAQMRGKVNLGELGYAGVAHFEIFKDGAYEFDHTFNQVLINGVKMGMENKKGTVSLRKGIYELRIMQNTHGGPHLSDVRLQIRNTESDEQVPVFCFGAEIERYLNQPFGPFKPTEVSGWKPVELPASK